MRSHYWTIGKFADWVRGTPGPGALTSEYYIPDRLNDIRYYINNRWVSHSHALTAHPRDIQPGNWSDVGSRFLPCMFNELVDFVEIEQAWHHCMWSDEAKTEFEVPWYRKGWLRWRTWRCPEAGMEYLKWASGLVIDENMGSNPDSKGYGQPTYQANSAKEIIELYTWWTVTYRARPDPYEASGWTAACEASREANGGKLSFSTPKDPARKKAQDKAHKLLQKIEADYEKEDEAMMIRLIKIRNSLWT